MLPVLTWAQEPETQEPAQVEDEKEEEKKPPRFHWDNGLWFQARHGKLRMKIGTQLQNDTAGFAGGGTQPVDLEGGVEWRRARLYTLGWFARRWRFKFQWDFVGGRGPSLADAWLGIDFTLWRQRLHFRGGRFSSTFGLENDGSSNDILFMEQGLTSAFVPPQETGVLIHSESNRRRWDLSFSSGADELECLICDVIGVAGRYSTSFTFGREDRRLHIGLNASRNWPDQAVNYAERPESHIAPVFVDTGPIPAERVDTGLAEGAYLMGPFSLQAEYGIKGVKSPDGSRPVFYAFYVSTSYALTGEMRPYVESLGTIRRIRPEREVRDGHGGLGAFEIAFRFSHIDLNDQNVTGGTLNDLTLGFNWYPTYPTRVSFNVIRAKREGWNPVWIFQGRWQLAY